MQANTGKYNLYSFISRWIFSKLFIEAFYVQNKKNDPVEIQKTSSNSSPKPAKPLKTYFMDQFLIFQYKVCADNQELIPNKPFFFIIIIPAFALDSWRLASVYIFTMIYSTITVCLGIAFPESIGVFLPGFYRKHASPHVFEKYCGNAFHAIEASVY